MKTPTPWAVMSERGDTDCAFEMRNGVKWVPFVQLGKGVKHFMFRKLYGQKDKIIKKFI